MILVLGTGRSGTSEVARFLHEVLGVHMGNAFHIGDQFNPKGYYEDREIQALHLSFWMMGLDKTDDKIPWKLWRERQEAYIASKKEPWGFKDPGVADVPELLNEWLKHDPDIIFTTRDWEDTIQSFMRMKGIDRNEAERVLTQRDTNNREALKDREYLEIDCYDPDKFTKIEKWYTMTRNNKKQLNNNAIH